MKKIRSTYNNMRWSSRFIGFSILLGVALAISFTSGWNPLITALSVSAFAVAMHFLISTTSKVLTGVVLLAQIGTMWPVYTLYANFVGTAMLNGAYIYSVIVVTLSTILITVIAMRYSVGRVWLTLLMSFVGLNVLGPLAMALLQTPSVLPGLVIAGLILASRCILWRDVFAKRSRDIPAGIKKKNSEEPLKNLLEAINGVDIQDREEYPIDLVAKIGSTSYYINAVHLNQRIVAAGESVASGNYNLNSTLYRTAELANKMDKSLKRKERGRVIPCVVNTADTNNSKLEVNITLRGDKTSKGVNTFILSPFALTQMLKKEAKQKEKIKA